MALNKILEAVMLSNDEKNSQIQGSSSSSPQKFFITCVANSKQKL